MEFLCYRGLNNIEGMSKYTYCGKCDGVILHAGDLSSFGEWISRYAEFDGDPDGFMLTGDIEGQNVRRSTHLSNFEGLPKRVLEELALIIKNNTPSKREIGVAA